MLPSCSGGGGGGGGTGGGGGGGGNTGNAQLLSVSYGRLVDVYGLRTVDEVVEKEVTAARFGDDVTQRPFSVVPRNVALQLNFSQSLGITDDFFYVVERGAAGDEQVVGVRNTEAIQLLEIVGDPNDGDPRGDFRVIPTRFVVRGDKLIVDPVLLGSEGATLQVRNSASGMPESPDQVGANIRIALALEGPLRIDGVTGIGNEGYLGANNQAFESVIRDFRSGNSADSSADIASGFVRD
ncbi:MAG: hypothetical protein ACO3UM_11575, partial [Planctomycetota bacterium]